MSVLQFWKKSVSKACPFVIIELCDLNEVFLNTWALLETMFCNMKGKVLMAVFAVTKLHIKNTTLISYCISITSRINFHVFVYLGGIYIRKVTYY